MTKAETIKMYMKKYGMSEADATEMYEYDEETDHMSMSEINKTLTAEQKQAVKDVTKTTSGKKKETAPKERKADEEKRMIMTKLFEIAKTLDENAVMTKIEKEIDIEINGNHYTIGLTKHRPPKK